MVLLCRSRAVKIALAVVLLSKVALSEKSRMILQVFSTIKSDYIKAGGASSTHEGNIGAERADDDVDAAEKRIELRGSSYFGHESYGIKICIAKIYAAQWGCYIETISLILCCLEKLYLIHFFIDPENTLT